MRAGGVAAVGVRPRGAASFASPGRGCPARHRGVRRPRGAARGGGGGARLRRAPLVHPAAPVHLALGEPGLGEGRALRSGGRWARVPLSQGSSRSAGEGPGAPRFLSGLSSAFPRVVLCVDEAGSRGPGFRGFTHTHTPLARLRASPAPGAGPALRPHKLVPLLCRVLLELVPRTPRSCPLPPGLAFEEGGFFLPATRTRFPAPEAGLGAPSGGKWDRAHPRGGACGWGAPFPAPAGPSPLPLVLPPRSAGLQPPGRDAGDSTLALE